MTYPETAIDRIGVELGGLTKEYAAKAAASARDPYFILPAIMAIAMFVQYKVNPTTPDPTQAKVMMVMPIAMSAMFAFFPAGLVLYYATNTILGLVQQWNINRRMGANATPQKA